MIESKLVDMLQSADLEINILALRVLCERPAEKIIKFFEDNGKKGKFSPDPKNLMMLTQYYISRNVKTPRHSYIYSREHNVCFSISEYCVSIWKLISTHSIHVNKPDVIITITNI